MKDDKNKQQRQQPQQNDMGQQKGSDQPMQGKQSSDQHPSGKQGQHPTGDDPSRKSQHQPHKAGMEQPMDVSEGDRRSDIENPDQQEQPGKKVNIDDNPDQTKKKVPNIHK